MWWAFLLKVLSFLLADNSGEHVTAWRERKGSQSCKPERGALCWPRWSLAFRSS